MADVFVSYAHEDRFHAAAVARAIAARGWSVWWDRRLKPGEVFSEVIERELAEARCVVVLWSRSSVTSKYVLTEAAEAEQREILIPARLEEVALPFEFRRRHAADLTAWSPTIPSMELEELLDAIGGVLRTTSDLPNPAPEHLPVKQQSSWRPAIGVLTGILLVLLLQSPQATIQPVRDEALAAEHDAMALDDMRHYEDLAIDRATFESVPSWSPDWELRFADASRDGEIVRVYHVMKRDSCDIRYVTRWDAETQNSRVWEPVTLAVAATARSR